MHNFRNEDVEQGNPKACKFSNFDFIQHSIEQN